MTTEVHSAQQPVLVILGVSGSGKSTVAGILAGQLGWDLEEGDDPHPAANVAKMAAGSPLTDDDRWPMLLASQISTLEPPGPDENASSSTSDTSRPT